jgi:hypothetical protein
MGTARTFPTDNFHAGMGGLNAPVDLETGELGPAKELTRDGQVVEHSTHPDSGGPIAGVRVPGWPRVREELLGFAARLPQAPYLGWDVVITDDGYSVIECNTPPAMTVHQVHGGILADPRCRAFFARHGMA